MEAADRSFIEGLRILFVARNCRKSGRGTVLSLGAESLAEGYQRQAIDLMMEGIGEGAPHDQNAPSVLPTHEGSHSGQDTSDPREGGGSLDWIW